MPESCHPIGTLLKVQTVPALVMKFVDWLGSFSFYGMRRRWDSYEELMLRVDCMFVPYL